MASITVRLQTTGPMFLKGADPRGDPEFRAASIRGQLRFWLRAILGAETQNLTAIWEQESAIFGSTGAGSKVMVRLRPNEIEVVQAHIVPHHEAKSSRESAIAPDKPMELTLSTKPGVSMPTHAMDALEAWALLGGMGKRSRRVFGGIQFRVYDKKRVSQVAVPDWFDTPPATVKDWIPTYESALARLTSRWDQSLGEPNWATLHPMHSAVVVGKETFGSAIDINKKLFSVLRGQEFRQHEKVFGFIDGQKPRQRRASPVIAQARFDREHNQYFPVVTVMVSPIEHPQLTSDYRPILSDFVKRIEREFDGVIVHGGPFA